MKESIINKLEQIAQRVEEINGLLADASVINDQTRFRALSQEYAQLTPIAALFQRYQNIMGDYHTAIEMVNEQDPQLRAMGEEELKHNKTLLEQLELEIQKALIPKDPTDTKNIFLEIRAGTGGDGC